MLVAQLLSHSSRFNSRGKSDEIKAQFAVVAKTLVEYQPIIEKADTSDAALATAEKLNIPLLKESNKAVQMLEASIK